MPRQLFTLTALVGIKLDIAWQNGVAMSLFYFQHWSGFLFCKARYKEKNSSYLKFFVWLWIADDNLQSSIWPLGIICSLRFWFFSYSLPVFLELSEKCRKNGSKSHEKLQDFLFNITSLIAIWSSWKFHLKFLIV